MFRGISGYQTNFRIASTNVRTNAGTYPTVFGSPSQRVIVYALLLFNHFHLKFFSREMSCSNLPFSADAFRSGFHDPAIGEGRFDPSGLNLRTGIIDLYPVLHCDMRYYMLHILLYETFYKSFSWGEIYRADTANGKRGVHGTKHMLEVHLSLNPVKPVSFPSQSWFNAVYSSATASSSPARSTWTKISPKNSSCHMESLPSNMR